MRNGKAPDGSILLSVYKDSLDWGTLPPTLYQAVITVLLKKDKDPISCASYRLTSLFNVDVKILAKVLAGCVEKIISSIISEEQNGLIKDRQLFTMFVLC